MEEKSFSLTIDRAELQQALRRLAPAANNKRAPLPVLCYLLFDWNTEGLTIRASCIDLVVSVKMEKAKADWLAPIKFLVPFRELDRTLKFAVEDTVYLVRIATNSYRISCGELSFSFHSISEDDFPPEREFKPQAFFNVPAPELLGNFSAAARCVSLDDSRKVLHGVLCGVSNNAVYMAATDGKRLLTIDGPAVLALSNAEVADVPAGIMPLDAVRALAAIFWRVKGDLKISTAENYWRFDAVGISLEVKIIEGNYPNYKACIPAAFKYSIPLNALEMITAIKSVIAFRHGRDGFVNMIVSAGKIEFSYKEQPRAFEAKNRININFDGFVNDEFGPEKTFDFNPDFLCEAALCGDVLEWQINDTISPVAFENKSNGRLYVMMPMRNR